MIWKGIDSSTINGLKILELPPIRKPKMRVSETSVDGLDGSVFEELGYETYDKTIKIGLVGNFDIDEVISYFSGEGDVVFDNEEDKYYRARIIDSIDYERLLRFRTANVKFRVQPFKYSADNLTKRFDAVKEATGTSSVSLTGVIADNFNKISVYGKSTQGSNPSPSNPQTITNITGTVGLTITNGTQTQTLNVNLGANELCSIGDIKDELVIKNGTAKIIKRIGKVVLDGSETYYLRTDIQTTNTSCFRTNVSTSISNNMVEGTPVLSSNFTCLDSMGDVEHIRYVGTKNYRIQLFVNKTSITDVSELQTWLSNNNSTIYYVLATPTEIDLGSVTQPTTYAGTTNVSNNKSADMKAIGYKERTLSVINSGNIESKPTMRIYGEGNVEVYKYGISIFSYTFPANDEYVDIDSDKQDAYMGLVLKNRNMTGEFIKLDVGRNNLSWTGNITKIEINNHNRWL